MRSLTAGVAALSLLVMTAGAATAGGHHHPGHHGPYHPEKTPTSRGSGGAVASVDPEASRVGIRVLKHGGNAVDAAVATAAALGVTEPFSSGLGGGGFFVYYDARTGRVHTIDGRETAPRGMSHDAFIDPATGDPYRFSPERVTSGVSIGVPGTPATWAKAVRKWGRFSMRKAFEPAVRLAERGFVVDQTFHDMVADNQQRFEAYTTTPRLYLRDGEPPAVGSVFRNPDLADTYRLLQRKGMRAFYRGRIAHQIARAVRRPPTSEDTDLPVPPGSMRARDLRQYRAITQRPTHSDYRGYDVYGMGPVSSGGSTVGEALNILEQSDAPSSTDEALHQYLESTALAFADRNAYVGDPAYVHVPLRDLLRDKFARERACEIGDTALTKPVPAQDVDAYDGQCDSSSASEAATAADTENVETTHLSVMDKWGNAVSYTLTIEQTGGSGMLLGKRGFLLNNELTDFSPEWVQSDPNRIEGGKKPRSSMSPTIVLDHGDPWLALGSPGGSTIITTVAQMLFNRVDRGMSIEEALAAPRASQRNTEDVTAEPEFVAAYGDALEARGHTFTEMAEIGAGTAVELGRHRQMTAVAEPVRRGGGSALVVRPRR